MSHKKGHKKGARLPFWVALATFGVCGLLLLLPGVSSFLWRAGGYLVALDVPGLKGYLEGFGAGAWVVSSLLMIFQALAAPIPAVPITLANGLIYGPWLGALISWSAAQVAAMICLCLSRWLGRPFVERLFQEHRLRRFDRFFERYGVLTILVARLIPVMSFDLISYAAGLTGIRLGSFFVATGLGQLPATLVYSFAGAHLADSPSSAVLLLLWFMGAAALFGGLLYVHQRHTGSGKV